jgi:hypothetical protein
VTTRILEDKQMLTSVGHHHLKDAHELINALCGGVRGAFQRPMSVFPRSNRTAEHA